MMDGITYKDIETMTLMVGSASGLPGQFSDSDKVCAENAGVDYMDVIQFLGKDLDLNYELSKEHTSEGIVILNNDHIYILENPYGEESRYRCVRSGLGPADGEGAGDRPVLSL